MTTMTRTMGTPLVMTVVVLLGTTTVALAQTPSPPRITNTVITLPDGMKMTYGLSVPANHESRPDEARPLVLALHPGGSAPYYGSNFMQRVVEPAIRPWNAIIVAPDVPARRWNNPTSEEAVLALVDDVRSRFEIDPGRILVTGFSMGGRGTWYFATRHSDLFTGAIAMAASRGDDPLDGLGSMPIQLIHSPSDEVVPFGPAVEAAEELLARDHPAGLIRVDGAGHYNMAAYVEPLSRAATWMWAEWEERP